MSRSTSPDAAWSELMKTPRVSLDHLDRDRVEASPGAFVLFRDGRPSYVGRSANLRATFAALYATQGPSAVSPVRRRVAEFLGIASVMDIAALRYRPTPEDHAKISRWIRGCSIAWQACATESVAVALEAALDKGRTGWASNGSSPKP